VIVKVPVVVIGFVGVTEIPNPPHIPKDITPQQLLPPPLADELYIPILLFLNAIFYDIDDAI
jgi:hypothetical protein